MTKLMPQTSAAEERMMQLITGCWVTQIVHGAAKFRYAEHFSAGPASAAEIARAARIDQGAAFRHLRACVALGLVEYDGRDFRATPLLDILRRDHPRSLHGLAMLTAEPGHWLPWGRLTDVLSTGKSQTRNALGMGVFDYFADHPEEAAIFTDAMTNMTASVADEVARVLDVRGVRRVVDVGGATGALLEPLLRKNPDLHGIVFDLPNVIAEHDIGLFDAAVRPRMALAAGDFFKAVPAADLHLLKYVLHDWNDEECVAILRNCRAALLPGGRVALVELVLGKIGETGLAPLMDVNMMVMLSGRERCFSEYADLLERAGFTDIRLIRTETPMALIEARVAAH